MPNKILIITSVQSRQRTLTTDSISSLNDAGFKVDVESFDTPHNNAVSLLQTRPDTNPPDAVVFDALSLPDLLTIRQIRTQLRRVWASISAQPSYIAIISTEQLNRPEWPDLIDDFVVAPISDPELIARLNFSLSRLRSILQHEKVSLADITINLTLNQVLDVAGRELPFTPREFELLKFLAEHRSKFFSRSNLIECVWGSEFDGGERTVDIHVRRLRAKLPLSASGLLETKRGLGYRIA